MSLIAIIIALTIERFLGSLQDYRRFDWFFHGIDWLQDRVGPAVFGRGALAVLATVGPVVLVVGVAQSLLDSVLGLLSFLFGVAVLLFCLGPRDLEADVESFLEARERDDEEAARWHANGLLEGAEPESPGQLSRAVTEGVLVQTNQRVLAVLFWFALIGPMGAALYRLTTVLRDRDGLGDEFGQTVHALQWLLDWLPARLCAVGYALSGNFVAAIHAWRERVGLWPDSNRGVLVATGLGALDQEEIAPDEPRELSDENVQAALALARRTVVVWLVVLALLTLAGWVG